MKYKYFTIAFFFLIFFLPLDAWSNSLKVYTWEDYGIEGTIPMVWGRHRYEHANDIKGGRPEGKGYSDARPPVEEAKKVAKELLKREEGERVLFLFGIGDTTDGLYNNISPADAIIHGPRVEPTRRWLREFFATLKSEGVDTIDYLVLDTEYGVNFWQIEGQREKVLQELQLADKKGLIDLPEKLEKLEPAKFRDWWNNKWVVQEFGQWVDTVEVEAVNDLIFGTLWEFYPGTPGSDYQGVKRAFETIDMNGWTNSGGNVRGTHSSPVTYIILSGNRYKDLPHKEALALAWSDKRNYVISCVMAGPTAPWYAWPTYEGDNPELYKHSLRMDVENGVRTLLIWGENRHWSESDRKVLSELVPELQAIADREPDPKVYPEDLPFLNVEN